MFKPKPAGPATHLLGIAIALAALGMSAGYARADDRKVDPFDDDEPGVQETYHKAIREGVAEYEARHFEEALGYFRRAHDLSPNARTLRGIGMTSFELRDYVTAMRSLTAALRDQRKPLSPGQRKDTQELLDRCRMFVAVYKLILSPTNSRITVDAKPVDTQPDGTLTMGLGEHLIEARADGYAKRSQSLRVRGGERSDLVLTLDPIQRVPRAAPKGSSEAPNPAVGNSAKGTPSPAGNRASILWILAGGGAAVLAAGAGVYTGVQVSELSSCRSYHPGLRCTDESVLVLQRNFGIAATAVAGAAAVTFVTIGILKWKSAPARPAPKQKLACGIGLAGLVCSGAF